MKRELEKPIPTGQIGMQSTWCASSLANSCLNKQLGPLVRAAAFRRIPFRGTGITDFLENDGSLEVAQRIAGHADSRTAKVYDRRGQKVLLEDMERICY
jgi:hypothetical protein